MLIFNLEPKVSFRLCPDLYSVIISSEDSAEVFRIFDLRIKIQKDTKKLISTKSDIICTFKEFVSDFKAWVSGVKPSTLEESKWVWGSQAVGTPVSERGHYTLTGSFISTLGPDSDKSLYCVIEKEREKEETNKSAKNTQDSQKTKSGERESKKKSANEDGTAHTRNASENSENLEKIAEQQVPAEVARKGSKTAFGKKNLKGIQRAKGFAESHVQVKRDSYQEVTSKIIKGPNGGYVITGPTGCGKSTVALLPLFEDEENIVLVVEPTQANAANIIHEFENVIPNLVSNGLVKGKVPPCRFVAPTVTIRPYARLSVTTAKYLLEYFYAYGDFPPVNYLIIDEFHLPIDSVVDLVELLRCFEVVPKYALVSATAVGFKIHSQLPSAVTAIEGKLPLGVLPRKIEGSDLDPRKWQGVGDGTVAVVAPSVEIARSLALTYRGWNLKTYLITRDTVVSKYLKAAENYRPNVVFVLEPGVEAGVTLSLSVLVSMGATTATRFDGKVVYTTTEPLDAVATIQRGGRGGRVRHTLYVTPKVPSNVEALPNATYLRAKAIIRCLALGADLKNMNCSDVIEVFPKLERVSTEAATAAVMTGGDPFMNLYRTSESGEPYRECGGTGTGFADLAKKELYLYHYKRGFFVAPIADFSSAFTRPEAFILREYQFQAARAIVASEKGLEEKYSLDFLVDLLIKKFELYVMDFFKQMKKIFNIDTMMEYSVNSGGPVEVADFLNPSPPLVKMFNHLATQPHGIKETVINTTKSNIVYTQRAYTYMGTSLNFSFGKTYVRSGSSGKGVDVAKLAADILEELKGLLAIEILANGAKHRCVNLGRYANKIPKEHTIYKSLA